MKIFGHDFNLKSLGYILMVFSIGLGTYVDEYMYPDVQLGVFTAFSLFLISVYILIIENKN